MHYNEKHTDHDLAGFARDGIDPETREPRKQPTHCPYCPPTLRATVWNRSGLCDTHDARMTGLSAAVGLRTPRPD